MLELHVILLKGHIIFQRSLAVYVTWNMPSWSFVTPLMTSLKTTLKRHKSVGVFLQFKVVYRDKGKVHPLTNHESPEGE